MFWHSYQNLSLGNKMHDMQEKGYQATYSAIYCYTTNTHLGLEPLAIHTSLSVSRNIKQRKTLALSLLYCRHHAKVIDLTLAGNKTI